MRHCYTKKFGSSFSVTVIPTLKDNFSYLIHDASSGELAAVDINSDVRALLKVAEDQFGLAANANKHRLQTIFCTHKHFDHIGGNEGLRAAVLSRYTQGGAVSEKTFTIVGGAKEKAIPGVTRAVKEGETIPFGGLKVDVVDVPCHTSGHVLYKVYNPSHAEDGAALFTGDTLFLGGLGAFFEGTAADMVSAMNKIYNINGNDAARDKETFIFPGHEYTAGFMSFAEKLYTEFSSPKDLEFVKSQKAKYAAAVAQGNPSVPSSLADEKIQNAFLRVADPVFLELLKSKGTDPVKIMEYLYNACD